MWLERVYLRGIRNLAPVDLNPAAGLNVIFGANGAGKTALLEGIHIGLQGRSFRSRELVDVVGNGQPAIEAALWFANGAQPGAGRRVTVRRDASEARSAVAVDGLNVSRLGDADLPIGVPLTQEELRGVRSSAERRRALVDVFLFHVKHDYAVAWRRYRTALRQRNAALRSGTPCAPWEGAMGGAAAHLHRQRLEHVRALTAALPDIIDALGLDGTLDVGYRAGWNSDIPLEDALSASRARDQVVGHTQLGPHRADLALRLTATKRASHVSAGQFKLAYLAFRLAQVAASGRQDVIFLADDLNAELDGGGVRRALDVLRASGAQVFITTPAETSEAASWSVPGTDASFHVERGAVFPVASNASAPF